MVILPPPLRPYQSLTITGVSGSVVDRPAAQHSCNPGWRWEWTDEASSRSGAIGGHYYGIPPTSWAYPRGTVWGCDCGRTFVSVGSRYLNMPGDCGWRREGRLARWLRASRESSNPGHPRLGVLARP